MSTFEKHRDVGTLQNTTGAATSVVSLSGITSDVGLSNYLIARVAVDNSGTSGAAPGLTVTDSKSNTWTVTTASNQDPGVANAGTTCYVAYARITTALTSADSITFTWGAGNPPAKAIVVEEWSGLHPTAPIFAAATFAQGSSATPSLTKSSGTGTLYYGAMSVEGPAGDTYTEDTDTLDGPWTSLTGLSTTDGTPANNQTIRGAYKICAGVNSQVWNPAITNRDWAMTAIVFQATPVSTASESWG